VSKELLDVVKIKLLEKNIDVEWKFEIPTQAMTIASMQGFEHLQYTTTDELLAGYVNHLDGQKALNYNIEDLLGFILK
jgi:capsid portal protein